MFDYDHIAQDLAKTHSILQTSKNCNCTTDTVVKVAKAYSISYLSSQELNRKKYSKAIIMCNLAGEPEQTFESRHDAARYLQQTGATTTPKCDGIIVHLDACANGKRKTAYKKIWKWKV